MGQLGLIEVLIIAFICGGALLAVSLVIAVGIIIARRNKAEE